MCSFISIGASIHACVRSGRHIVALEVDEGIFKEIIEPLRKEIPRPNIEETQKRKAPSTSAHSPDVRPKKNIIAKNCLST